MAPKPHWGKWCSTLDTTDTDSAHTASYTQIGMSPEDAQIKVCKNIRHDSHMMAKIKVKSKTSNYLLLQVHGIPEVDGELTNVQKGVLVGHLCVKRVHLSQGPLHEINHWKSVGGSELAVLHVGNVHLLQTGKRNSYKLCHLQAF